MDNLTSLYQHTPDSIILNEFLKIISSNPKKVNIGSFIKYIVKACGKVGLILILKHLLSKSDIIEYINYIFNIFIRKNYILKNRTDRKHIDYFLYNELTPLFGNEHSITVNGLKINFENGVLNWNRILHTTFIDNLFKLAKDKLDKDEPNNKCKFYLFHDKKSQKPKKLFPSNNYINLSEILRRQFEVSELSEMYTPLGILINGEPGLGKSAFADYFSNLGLCDIVIRIDMTHHLKENFEEIENKVMNQIKVTDSCVILFDELDKYLDYYINDSYNNIKVEKDETKINYDEYLKNKKMDFMYFLVRLLEQTGHQSGLVYIFCSNNFHTIFKGIEYTHFDSLLKRFMVIEFNRANSIEIENYIKFYNDSLIGSDYYLEKIEEIVSKLKEELSIPYRNLRFLTIKSEYNWEKLVQLINEWSDSEQYLFEKKDISEKIVINQNNDKESSEKVVNDKESSEKVVNDKYRKIGTCIRCNDDNVAIDEYGLCKDCSGCFECEEDKPLIDGVCQECSLVCWKCGNSKLGGYYCLCNNKKCEECSILASIDVDHSRCYCCKTICNFCGGAKKKSYFCSEDSNHDYNNLYHKTTCKRCQKITINPYNKGLCQDCDQTCWKCGLEKEPGKECNHAICKVCKNNALSSQSVCKNCLDTNPIASIYVFLDNIDSENGENKIKLFYQLLEFFTRENTKNFLLNSKGQRLMEAGVKKCIIRNLEKIPKSKDNFKGIVLLLADMYPELNELKELYSE
jgi:hypothetical protein